MLTSVRRKRWFWCHFYFNFIFLPLVLWKVLFASFLICVWPFQISAAILRPSPEDHFYILPLSSYHKVCIWVMDNILYSSLFIALVNFNHFFSIDLSTFFSEIVRVTIIVLSQNPWMLGCSEGSEGSEQVTQPRG